MRLCPECGASMGGRPPRAVTCSAACRKARSRSGTATPGYRRHTSELPGQSVTELPGVRDWITEAKMWRCVIAGSVRWIPSTATVRYIFGLDEQGGLL